MKKKMVIFGAAEQAEVSHYYFENDSNYVVEGFIVDDEYFESSNFHGLPVIPWSLALQAFPPTEYDCFVALGYTKVNVARKEIYEKVKKAGYQCPSYVSSSAVTFNDLVLGDNCLILENNTVQPFVEIGSNTTVWSGNHIGHHSIIHDHNFVSSHVVISGHCEIESNCFLGVNSTLAHKVKIASGTLLGAGVVISKNTEKNRVYVANRPIILEKISNEINL